jgi:hypothetical protein
MANKPKVNPADDKADENMMKESELRGFFKLLFVEFDGCSDNLAKELLQTRKNAVKVNGENMKFDWNSFCSEHNISHKTLLAYLANKDKPWDVSDTELANNLVVYLLGQCGSELPKRAIINARALDLLIASTGKNESELAVRLGLSGVPLTQEYFNVMRIAVAEANKSSYISTMNIFGKSAKSGVPEKL